MLLGGISILKQTIRTMNPSEQIAAKYILEYPEKMVEMTVSELADASGSSQSAIIRLCKTLGLKGYQDLKLRVAGDLYDGRKQDDEYKEISQESTLEMIISSVSNNHIYSINETLKIVNVETMQKAVDILADANRIDFYGAGASQLVAQDAQHKFMRINKTCTAYPDPHLQLTSAVSLTPNDVALAFSNSGETKQVIDCMKVAKECGAFTIGITRYGQNTLSQLVDLHIEILSSESDIRSAATSSRIVQLNIIDILYVAVASHRYDKSLEYLNRSRSAIKNSFRMK